MNLQEYPSANLFISNWGKVRMDKIFENNFVGGKLRESSDLTRDLITIYNKDFFEKFVGYFEAEPHPLDLVETTLDTARAYIHAWQEKLANKSDFGTFTGRHILKAGIAARDLEYSLRQLSKSDLAAFILKRNLENVANGKSIKTDQIIDYINRQYGPAEPLEIYRIFADAITRAANGLIPLPDEEETESQYIARGDAFSKEIQSNKWKKISELPAHHALQQAAVVFKPLWEQHSNRLYYKGRYDETKGGFHSPPASALHFLIRKIDPEVKRTMVGTAIGKIRVLL